ncbi:variant surface glycoprotein 3275 [Trypanosoma theileri]|uniref:Variant surface glycoprotein 3275 n=1 Tax=Trypanosoma theileri TaxID=67003 RepID=A0A1X0NZ87_9TRYP|nr:variant surface glycoprotein 3275 [Trypanosoma theileri]ORC89911.1 variant surface glycoprotein 3275 [Trypanosoma theileri]
MAIAYPKVEDQQLLIDFATTRLKFTSEDVELLNTTCTALIDDADAISGFVFGPASSSSNNMQQTHSSLSATQFPIHYCHGDMSRTSLSSVSTSTICGPFSDTRALFRSHEASLRSIQLRLRRGRTVLNDLNEKYNYAFTVVTFGRSKKRGSVKGETVAEGREASVQAIAPNISSREELQENGASETNSIEGNTLDTNCVQSAYAKFIQTFDSLILWLSNVVAVLDGEGSVPSSGRHIIQEQSLNEGKQGKSNENETVTRSTDNAESLPIVQDSSSTQQVLHEGDAKPSETPSVSTKDSSTPARRYRTVRVTTYEVHDVSSIFYYYQNQSNLFYLTEYTFYDPRIQRRLLLPSYYQSLRDTINEINTEIERLKQLGVTLARERSNAITIAFRPPICEFCYLRDSLRLYWSWCVTEDDITSFQYHRMQYNKCVLEAGEVMEMLKQLRRPPASNAANSAVWVPIPEERFAVEAGFESFWRLRERVLELRDSLTGDIEKKNRTHRYRVPAPSRIDANVDDTNKSGAITQWALSALRSWVQLVTCTPETSGILSLAERDNEGFLLSTSSPMYKPKAELLCLVQRLTTAVEVQATTLEREFPGTFFRDAKAMWAKRAGGVMRYMESVSVVFSRPG